MLVYQMINGDDIHNEAEQSRLRGREHQPRLFRPGGEGHSEGGEGEEPTTPERLFIQIAGVANKALSLGTIIETGAPAASLRRIMEELKISKKDMLVYIDMSPATYARRTKRQSRLTTTETDRVYRYTRLLSLATNMFHGDRDEARRWLKSPAYAFKGETPLEHARTEFGAHEVETLIGRIEHGIPS